MGMTADDGRSILGDMSKPFPIYKTVSTADLVPYAP